MALKKRKDAPSDTQAAGGNGAGPSSAPDQEADAAATQSIVLPARKRRAIDVLQETLATSEDDGSSDGDDGGLVLDWRQKAVK